MRSLVESFYVEGPSGIDRVMKKFGKEGVCCAQVASKEFTDEGELKAYLDECVNGRFIPWVVMVKEW